MTGDMSNIFGNLSGLVFRYTLCQFCSCLDFVQKLWLELKIKHLTSLYSLTCFYSKDKTQVLRLFRVMKSSPLNVISTVYMNYFRIFWFQTSGSFNLPLFFVDQVETCIVVTDVVDLQFNNPLQKLFIVYTSSPNTLILNTQLTSLQGFG